MNFLRENAFKDDFFHKLRLLVILWSIIMLFLQFNYTSVFLWDAYFTVGNVSFLWPRHFSGPVNKAGNKSSEDRVLQSTRAVHLMTRFVCYVSLYRVTSRTWPAWLISCRMGFNRERFDASARDAGICIFSGAEHSFHALINGRKMSVSGSIFWTFIPKLHWMSAMHFAKLYSLFFKIKFQFAKFLVFCIVEKVPTNT